MFERIWQWIDKRRYDAYARKLGYKNWKEYVDRTILESECQK